MILLGDMGWVGSVKPGVEAKGVVVDSGSSMVNCGVSGVLPCPHTENPITAIAIREMM